MNKQNILNLYKRMLGRKLFIITDYNKYQGAVGVVNDILNEKTLKIEIDGSLKDISIFDVRSIPYEF